MKPFKLNLFDEYFGPLFEENEKQQAVKIKLPKAANTKGEQLSLF